VVAAHDERPSGGSDYLEVGRTMDQSAFKAPEAGHAPSCAVSSAHQLSAIFQAAAEAVDPLAATYVVTGRCDLRAKIAPPP
jgi:hypothetical protein